MLVELITVKTFLYYIKNYAQHNNDMMLRKSRKIFLYEVMCGGSGWGEVWGGGLFLSRFCP